VNTSVATQRGVTIEPDGRWCPMAHANRWDDSFQDLPPLRRRPILQPVGDPIGALHGGHALGAFSGEDMAVCVYGSDHYPAVVAYDLDDGGVRWTSPCEDLVSPDHPFRSGVLMARVQLKGAQAHRCVFAASRAGIVAYSDSGERIWLRQATQITPATPDGIGTPIALSYADSGALVTATSTGWVIKLDPCDGTPLDAYRMETRVSVGGRMRCGYLATFKAPIVIGDVMYLVVEFKPDTTDRLPEPLCPCFLVRIELGAWDSAIKPLAVPCGPDDRPPDRIQLGTGRARASPSATVGADGGVLICASAHGARPVIAGVEDIRGALGLSWEVALDSGETIYAAPALHRPSGTLLVSTMRRLVAVPDASDANGQARTPVPLSPSDLLMPRVAARATHVSFGSPFALTYDKDREELVAYTNVRVRVRGRTYGMLGAFSLLPGGAHPRALWTCPLSADPTGSPLPGRGTLGQPALFRYAADAGEQTGLIVTTVSRGTYMLR
jgi:hypothetical protein